MLLVAALAVAVFILPPGWGVAVVSVAIVIEIAEVGFWVRFLRRYRVRTGIEGLIGTEVAVIEACDPHGRVRFRGETWHARCEGGAGMGDRVVVTGLHGLTLEVEPAPENGKGPR